MLNEHYTHVAYRDLENYRANELFKLLARSYQYIDNLTEEQMILLSLTATLAMEAGYRTGVLSLDEQSSSPDWRHVLVIDLPVGQISFPVPTGLLHHFRAIPLYVGHWNGYNSEPMQKHRMLSPGCAVNGYNETIKCPRTITRA